MAPGIPIEGDPADVTAIVDAYADWLKVSIVPKLFLKAEPGGILAGGKRIRAFRAFWPKFGRELLVNLVEQNPAGWREDTSTHLG